MDDLSLEKQLELLKRRLLSNQWSLSYSDERIALYEGPLDDAKQPIRLLLPSNPACADTAVMLSKALTLLAAIGQ